MGDNSTDFTKNDILDGLNSEDITSTTDFVMPKEETMVQKRAREDGSRYGEPPAKKPVPSIRVGAGFKWNLQALAVAADAVESGGKSPVSALNELGVRVNYTILRQGGPAHCPSFTVAVTLNVSANVSVSGLDSKNRLPMWRAETFLNGDYELVNEALNYYPQDGQMSRHLDNDFGRTLDAGCFQPDVMKVFGEGYVKQWTSND